MADKFVYLGSTISRSIAIDEEVSYSGIAKPSSAFGRLRDRVWNRRRISLQIKLKVCRAIVRPSFVCFWNMDCVQSSCQAAQLFSHWKDKFSDIEVLARAEMQSVHAVAKLALLMWAGHVCRMPRWSSSQEVALSVGQLKVGKRSQGGQRKRYKDTLNVFLEELRYKPQHLGGCSAEPI